jgi:hypothetical protein
VNRKNRNPPRRQALTRSALSFVWDHRSDGQNEESRCPRPLADVPEFARSGILGPDELRVPSANRWGTLILLGPPTLQSFLGFRVVL